MIALSCTGISKVYGIETIIENISFTVNVGDKVGLIGINGAGKTTLMKILAGIETKDSGDIFISKDMTIGYLEQNTNIDLSISAYDYCEEIFGDLYAIEMDMRKHEEMMADHESPDYNKILENYAKLQETFEAQNGYAISSRIKGVLTGLGFEPTEHNKPINQLSGGQKSRVGIARMLLRQPDILFLDEPTNHLDIDAIKWLENYLKDYSGTIVLISHDRYFLDQVVTHIYEIEYQELKTYKGNYTAFLAQKAANYEAELKKFETQQKDIQKQEELIRKFKDRGTEKLAKRAKSREKRLAHVSPSERPRLFKTHFKIKLKSDSKSGKEVLKVEALYKSYGEHSVLNDLNLDMYNGERIGLIGPNGVGKTTLFKLLIGEIQPDTGDMIWGHNVQTGYYDQEQKDLHLEKTILEEIHDDNPHLSLTEVRTLLGAFLFTNDDIEKYVHQLSGGERSRVSLLKLMLSSSNVLFLDEPTNHLDIYSKETLEDALLGYDGTIMSISHDRYFLNKICTKIFELTPEGLNIYWGNYDYAQEKKAEALIESNAPEEKPLLTKTMQKDLMRKEKEIKAAQKKQKNRLTSVEKEIETKEEEMLKLEQELCDPSVFSNPEKSMKIQSDMTDLKEFITKLYLELEELLESI